MLYEVITLHQSETSQTGWKFQYFRRIIHARITHRAVSKADLFLGQLFYFYTMELILASNNAHKLKEIREALGDSFEVRSLQEKGITEDIPETHDTLEGNAIEKAHYIYTKYGISCFADDTGLEVEALDNRPGVYSASYNFV